LCRPSSRIPDYCDQSDDERSAVSSEVARPTSVQSKSTKNGQLRKTAADQEHSRTIINPCAYDSDEIEEPKFNLQHSENFNFETPCSAEHTDDIEVSITSRLATMKSLQAITQQEETGRLITSRSSNYKELLQLTLMRGSNGKLGSECLNCFERHVLPKLSCSETIYHNHARSSREENTQNNNNKKLPANKYGCTTSKPNNVLLKSNKRCRTPKTTSLPGKSYFSQRRRSLTND
jgi:hypothetical protein